MRVALLPTGRTEWHGLPTALQRLFPQHTFYAIHTDAEIKSEPNHFPYDGFTSATLTNDHCETPPHAALALLRRAAQEALGDRSREAADLVLIVDDLELNNLDQPDLVLKVMRAAARQHLNELNNLKINHGDRVYRKTCQIMRERISFHLIAPMIEAWFFADEEALNKAGVPQEANFVFSSSTDPEDFYTDDPGYRAATQSDCPALLQTPESKRKKLRPKWISATPRERHPKGYLQWLCRDPQHKNCTTYNETQGGAEALKHLSWSAALQRPDTHFGFLRALLDDLAQGLNQELPGGLSIGPPHPLMRDFWSGAAQHPDSPLLRNI